MGDFFEMFMFKPRGGRMYALQNGPFSRQLSFSSGAKKDFLFFSLAGRFDHFSSPMGNKNKNIKCVL